MKIYFQNAGSFCNINDARVKSFFKSPNSSLRSTILLRKGLVEHIKNSCFHTAWILKEYQQNANLPDPRLWGWTSFFTEVLTLYCKSQKNAVLT